MASGQNTPYACRCLNVRITTSSPPSASPEYPRDPNYTPVFVKDDGISVIHPQVTVRLPSKGVAIPGTSRHSRFTTVCCLFCQLNIYRVHQTIPSEVVGGEVTLLPTEEWVEHEIMKSASGWIEIHKQSIVGDDISNAENSSSFAPSFSLLLPSTSSPPSSPNLIVDQDSSREPEPSSEATPEYLADMRPVFQPPPFTPSNPVFVHLAAIASRESGQLRATAEGRIKDFISAERAGIEVKELELRRQVEVLWKHFRRHLSTVEQERNTNTVNSLRSPIRVKDGEKFLNGLASPSQLSSSVTIRSFIPQPISPPPLAPSTSAPRVSALSASLATTRFHHPRHERHRSSGSGSSVSYGSRSNSSKGESGPDSATSTLIPPTGHAVVPLKKNLDDYLNAQVSYSVLVSEDMARNKRSQAAAISKPDVEAVKHPKEAGPSQAVPGFTTNGNEKPDTAQIAESQHSVEESEAEGEATPSRGRDKGKRKVTFDVEADVVAIPSRKDVNSGEAATAEDPRDMIFALEDLDGVETETQQGSLPFIDQPLTRPTKARRPRPPTNGAHEAFSSLRPASLPSPSHMRPMRSQPGVDSSSQGMILNLPKASGSPNILPRTLPTSTPLTENDAALLKLVAADTPSHRGAWTPESRAWQMFTRRQDSKENVVHSNIPENSEVGQTARSSTVTAPKPIISKMKLVFSAGLDDDDDEDYVDTVPGSLPIQIHRQMPIPELTLASYQPPATVFEEPASPTPAPSNKPLSSAAIRKAAYLARDRNRSMDPGTLDFAVEEEDEDEEGEESQLEQGKGEASDPGEKGRKHALKILQARSELPADGMWRSLA
ncbi:hypothetical protein M413DRAFT_441575 [Hebeloma cylindrosporum]|uniref:Uncharacterized protein n=1 Tax=Hebeloma cylindrosporum TaxID=76867 RepID=A0A0C2YZT0_HEBCY|nr:hypothetical protein M413DRAFT_441575 [Hebeloma cylindrosporum h7]